MAYIIALNQRPRTPRQQIGQFLWSPRHQRYILHGKVLATGDDLAAAVNEALPLLKQIDNPFIDLQVEIVAGEEIPEPVQKPRKLVLKN